MVNLIDMRAGAVKHSGNSGRPTQLHVLHSGETPLRRGYAVSLTEWSRDSAVQASWQFWAGPEGVVEYIPSELAAWQAGWANPISKGWEQSGYARFSRAEWTTPDGMAQLENLAWHMAREMKHDGIPLVWLTTAQVQNIVFNGDTRTKGLCIHAQIDPARRTDPGKNYPFDLLTERIAAHLGTTPTAPPAPTPAPSVPKTNYVPDPHWRIDPGETLGLVAQHYGTTVSKLAAWNGIRHPDIVHVGERIWAPGSGFGTWTVDPGDTLSTIVAWCRQNWSDKITVQSVCYANGINNPNVLPVGLRLKIA